MTMKQTVVGATQKQNDKWWEKSVTETTNLSDKGVDDDPRQKSYQQITFQLGNFNDEERTFQAIASTPIVDRQGDSIDQSGWDLTNFLKNPVVPWAHDYQTPPVARATEIGVNSQGYLQFTYQAPPVGVYELADTVWNLYRNQFMFAFSVGFIPKDYEGNYQEGYTFTECELLEISAVVVPANPQAVALAFKMDVISERQAKTLRGKMSSAVKNLEEAMSKTEKKETKQAKGAIADELQEEENQQTKWELMEQVYDIWWAFTDVWYDEETPASDFQSLLKELAGLLNSVADGEQVVPDNDDDDDDKPGGVVSPLLHALRNGVDKDKVEELINTLAAKSGKGLTNHEDVKDNSNMTKSQKDSEAVTKSNSTLSKEDMDSVMELHKDMDDFQKKMGDMQVKMEKHKVHLQRMHGFPLVGGNEEANESASTESSEDAASASAAGAAKGGDSAPKDAKSDKVKEKDLGTEGNTDEDNKPGEAKPAVESPVVQPKPVDGQTEEVSSDEQDDKTKSEQGEVKSADKSDDGADHKVEEANDVDPDNLTDEQAEEVIKAINEALEEAKKEADAKAKA
jgi:hypothetical protein